MSHESICGGSLFTLIQYIQSPIRIFCHVKVQRVANLFLIVNLKAESNTVAMI